MSHLLVLGLSHKTAPIGQREKASLSETEARATLRALARAPEIDEAVALSTCNRTELYAATHDLAHGETVLAQTLLDHSEISVEELACARYLHRDAAAAGHLFRVASSLDSMVIGESEIQGQVRTAWELAREEGVSGPVLNRLFRGALEVGKRVRHQTRIGAGAASVPSVAVELACEAIAASSRPSVLVVGAGGMAAQTARALTARHPSELVIANRTIATARELAGEVGARGVGFDRLGDELARVDVVISATDAPHAILDRGGVETVLSRRGGAPLVVVDIAVPRDVDPDIASLPAVTLYDIDDLERVVEDNVNGRRSEAARAELIVVEAVHEFCDWRGARAAAPTIAGLHERAESIRRAELARVEGQWESLSESDRARLEALTRSIVGKLLHEPTVRARDAANGDGERHLESLRHLFGLESAPPR